MKNPLTIVKSWLGAEGSYKTPGWGMTTFGNWFPIGFGDGFERDRNLQNFDASYNTTVEACIGTISQTIAMLPVHHVRTDDDGGTEIIKTSAASRVLRKPNPFQTKSEFFVDLIRQTLFKGNGYGVCTRNNRYEIKAIYPQIELSPFVSLDQRDVYYSGFLPELIDDLELQTMIPSRDVLHFKMHTKNHPLEGVTPLVAAMVSANTANSIQGHTNRFFANMSRPSGVLSTDMTLKPEQTKALRERFEEMAKKEDTGGLPILTSGLKYQQISMNAVDSEIIATYNMTKSDIASVFRVPLALIGDMEKATFANTETLMKYWVSSGLGFVIEHLENSLDDLFDLPSNEHIEFDTEFLLQADFKSRIDGFKSGVQGGIFTPNEVRKKEGLKPQKGGDALLVQMQMIPIGLSGEKLQAEIDAVNNPPEPTTLEVIEDEVVNDVPSDAAKMMLKGCVNEV